MAVDVFLKVIDSSGRSVPGDVTGAGPHSGEIQILSWSWGAGHFASVGQGGTPPVDMSLIKYLDRSSIPLFVACAGGKQFQSATLTLVKAGERPFEFLRITMTNVFVTSLDDSEGGEDRPTESISLAFEKVKIDYHAQDASGRLGASTSATWNFLSIPK